MENHSKNNAARRNGTPLPKTPRASKALANSSLFDHWPYLQQAKQGLREARPEAVSRAKKLIAADDYPSKQQQRALARRLAIQLTADLDSLPT